MIFSVFIGDIVPYKQALKFVNGIASYLYQQQGPQLNDMGVKP